jgi:hypothetical protein
MLKLKMSLSIAFIYLFYIHFGFQMNFSAKDILKIHFEGKISKSMGFSTPPGYE